MRFDRCPRLNPNRVVGDARAGSPPRSVAIDIGRVRWADVDTPADRESAERLLIATAARL